MKKKSQSRTLTFQSSVRGHGRKEPYHGKTHRPRQSQTRRRKNHLRAESGRNGNPAARIQVPLFRNPHPACPEGPGTVPAVQRKKCIQPTPGYMPLVVYYAGTVREAMHPCPYENIQKREWRKQHLLDQAGLPEMFRSSTFAEYQVDEGNRKAVETIRKMAADPQENRGFISMGLPGWGRPCWRPCTPKKRSSREKLSGS